MFLFSRQSGTKGTSQHRFRPRLEVLEERWVPAANNPTDFVIGVYNTVLHRAPSADEITAALNSSADRAVIANGIMMSPGGAANQVNDLYIELLLRPFDLGAAPFTAGIQAGTLRLQDVRAAIMASDEYFSKFGENQPSLWVAAIYADVLGRTPDPGSAGFGANAGTAAGRFAAAQALLASTEARTDQAIALYTIVLNRAGDAGGIIAQANGLSTLGEQTIVLSMLASAEFFARG